MRRSVPLITLALALFAPGAHANGRIPEANQLVVDEADPTFLVLRTSYGLLVSRDRGTNWDWVCESAFGNSGTYDPPIAIAAGKTLFLGTFAGLRVSESGGCSWAKKPPLDARYVLDVATRPGAPNETIAVTNNGITTADGGFGYESWVARSSDGAKTWNLVGTALDPTLVVDTVDFARGDADRVYVSARLTSPTVEAFLLVSTDGAKTFATRPIPLVSGEVGAYIATVDPVVSDRVYVRTTAFGDSGPNISAGRLLVTDDAGKTWTERWRGGPPLGFALSPDGKKVWVGDGFGGLWAADTTTFAFTKVQSFLVKCLTATNDRLYACSTESAPADADPMSGFILGESTDDGASFRALYKLKQIRGPLACASDTDTAKCAAEWPQLQLTLGIDAGKTQPPAPAPTEPDGCGCRSAGGPAAGAGAGLTLVLALAAAMRRRRR
jgi:MYXO-CTERM domain-containing protein